MNSGAKDAPCRCAAWSMLALAACSGEPSVVDVAAYGGRVRVSCAQPLPVAVRSELRGLMLDHDQRLHPWRADSELQALNRALAEGRAVVVSPTLRRALEAARRGHQLTLGAFDPAYGSRAEVGQQRPTFAALMLDQHGRVTGPQTLRLDLNAIAEGTLARAVAERLGPRFDCLIDSGGDLYAFGRDATRRWRVAVEDPQSLQPGWELTLKSGDALYVSGRYRQPEHLRGSLPAAVQPLQVSVLDRDPERADALATALMVADAATRALIESAVPAAAIHVHFESAPCSSRGDWAAAQIQGLPAGRADCLPKADLADDQNRPVTRLD